MKSHSRWFVLVSFVTLTLLMNMPCLAEPAEKPSLELAMSDFVRSFDNLDWEHFRACFTEDATVFHPAPPNLKRTEGRDGFEKAWLGVFERIRKTSGRTAPPYMDLQPKDLRIQYLSDDVALVTFHLDDGQVLGRRTIVWKRSAGAWKIVHIHASNFPEPDKSNR